MSDGMQFGFAHTGEGHPGDIPVECIYCAGRAWVCQPNFTNPMPLGAPLIGICSYQCLVELTNLDMDGFLEKVLEYGDRHGLERPPPELLAEIRKDFSATGINSAGDKFERETGVNPISDFVHGKKGDHPTMTDDNDEYMQVDTIPINLRIPKRSGPFGAPADDNE